MLSGFNQLCESLTEDVENLRECESFPYFSFGLFNRGLPSRDSASYQRVMLIKNCVEATLSRAAISDQMQRQMVEVKQWAGRVKEAEQSKLAESISPQFVSRTRCSAEEVPRAPDAPFICK